MNTTHLVMFFFDGASPPTSSEGVTSRPSIVHVLEYWPAQECAYWPISEQEYRPENLIWQS